MSILLAAAAHAAPFDCLVAGNPGKLDKKKRCQALLPYQVEKPKACPSADYMCNPLAYGAGVCLPMADRMRTEADQLRLCAGKARPAGEVVRDLKRHTPPYERLDSLLQEMKVLCAPDVGEASWKERCALFFPRLLEVEAALDKQEGAGAPPADAPVTVTPTGEVLVNPEAFGGAGDLLKFADKYLTKKKALGERPSPDEGHDVAEERKPSPKAAVTVAEKKKSAATVLEAICAGAVAALGADEQRTFFDLTYALYLDGEFKAAPLKDREAVFCFLKKGLLARIAEAGADLKLMDLIATVPKGQKWDCP